MVLDLVVHRRYRARCHRWTGSITCWLNIKWIISLEHQSTLEIVSSTRSNFLFLQYNYQKYIMNLSLFIFFVVRFIVVLAGPGSSRIGQRQLSILNKLSSNKITKLYHRRSTRRTTLDRRVFDEFIQNFDLSNRKNFESTRTMHKKSKFRLGRYIKNSQ